MADLIGQTIAGYPIERPLDPGSYGMIYQATTSAEPVAIKLLREPLRGDRALADAMLAGWEKCRAVAHPGLVTVFSTGIDEQYGLYCISELSKVRSLRNIVIEGMKLNWKDALAFAEEIGKALKALHDANLVHGDVWPGAIFVNVDQDVKLEGAGALCDVPRPLTELLEKMALSYTAPERLDGALASKSTDLYGLGAIFYYILAGVEPFSASDVPKLVQLIKERPPTPIATVVDNVPEEVASFIDRLLAKDPTHRYGLVDHVLADIDALKSGKPMYALKGGPAPRFPGVAPVAPPSPFGGSPKSSPAVPAAKPAGSMASLAQSVMAGIVPSVTETQPIRKAPNKAPVIGVGEKKAESATPSVTETQPVRRRFGPEVAPSSNMLPKVDAPQNAEMATPRSLARAQHGVADEDLTEMGTFDEEIKRRRGKGPTRLFGKLDTHVGSTIPQSDAEREGDAAYRRSQLAVAMEAWKLAWDSGQRHTGLWAKLELGHHRLMTEKFEMGVGEARMDINAGDFEAAEAHAKEAAEACETPEQSKEVDKLREEIGSALAAWKKKKETKTLVLLVVGAAVIFAGVAAAFLLLRGE
ncbi:MAG: protein kinase [Planctomycetes bacterium]|nr:protein kinase [Planctomycetota bacterium]